MNHAKRPSTYLYYHCRQTNVVVADVPLVQGGFTPGSEVQCWTAKTCSGLPEPSQTPLPPASPLHLSNGPTIRGLVPHWSNQATFSCTGSSSTRWPSVVVMGR